MPKETITAILGGGSGAEATIRGFPQIHVTQEEYQGAVGASGDECEVTEEVRHLSHKGRVRRASQE